MSHIISYYGGKQRLSKKLIALIPRHTVFVEPFCGGATVFFNKPFPKVTNSHHYREILNDKNDYIISLYRECRDNGKSFFEKLNLTPYSKSEHARALEIYRNQDSYSQSEKAWSCYVNANTSFASTLAGGWRRSVFGRNPAASHKNKLKALPDLFARLSDVHIENTCAIDCIKKWDSPQTFFYCDPPYPGAHQGHYSGYTLDDFKRLVDALDAAQGSFMLSCYDVDLPMPSDWEKLSIEVTTTASGAGKTRCDRSRKATASELGNLKRTEIVYRRFNRVPVRDEIAKLYETGKYDCFVGKPGMLPTNMIQHPPEDVNASAL